MAAHHGYCDMGFAKLDTGRLKRRGFAEAIYCPGKTLPQLKAIASKFITLKQPLLLTKLSPTAYAPLKKTVPHLRYSAVAQLGYWTPCKRNAQRTLHKDAQGNIVVVSAGTSDIPIAEEAALTAEVLGNTVQRLYDVGVAGVHRLLDHSHMLRSATVIIVVAGMEGALASVVSGLVSCPVIAVPTSCGYGSSFSGLAALLSMLNGCSPGVAVVNIDNGFGAGYFASVVAKKGG
jgi:pyridinium-3,5-biscarboxylic acid mononucleotide synthase